MMKKTRQKHFSLAGELVWNESLKVTVKLHFETGSNTQIRFFLFLFLLCGLKPIPQLRVIFFLSSCFVGLHTVSSAEYTAKRHLDSVTFESLIGRSGGGCGGGFNSISWLRRVALGGTGRGDVYWASTAQVGLTVF